MLNLSREDELKLIRIGFSTVLKSLDEPKWTKANREQAEGRFFRVGQEKAKIITKVIKKRKRYSAAYRKAASIRMKKYWAAQRKLKK